jgi:hypothetical protein
MNWLVRITLLALWLRASTTALKSFCLISITFSSSSLNLFKEIKFFIPEFCLFSKSFSQVKTKLAPDYQYQIDKFHQSPWKYQAKL